jgi:NAD-dependent SIR2 family protein deacetylase
METLADKIGISKSTCFLNIKRIKNHLKDTIDNPFKNEEDECVAYFLLDGVLVVRRGVRMASTTPEFLEISGLTFDVTDNLIIAGASARVQPRITIKMRAAARNETLNTVMLNMQTTISSRFYE